MSSFGLIEENMQLSYTHFAVTTNSEISFDLKNSGFKVSELVVASGEQDLKKDFVSSNSNIEYIHCFFRCDK